MRIWLEPEVLRIAAQCGLENKIVWGRCGKPAELKWWLGAYNPGGPRKGLVRRLVETRRSSGVVCIG